MPEQETSGIVFSFPDLPPDQAAQFVDAFKVGLLQKGVDAAQFRVACSNNEAMALGGVLILLGTAFLEAATKKAAEAVLNILIEKYKTIVVAKSPDGASWSYGEEYRKGGKPEVAQKEGVDYGTLGLVLLGASRFPRMQGKDNESFARSAALIKETFTPEHTLFRSTKLLDLFDLPLSPGEIIEKVEGFLDDNPDILDLMMYYIGHGDFLSDRTYFLVLRNTKAGGEASTGLKVRDMRLDLESRLVNKRWYLVLDCCYAGEALKELQASGIGALVRTRMMEAMPPSGWAALLAAPADMPAIAPQDKPYTMFSGALADTLKTGAPHIHRHFSFSDLADQTRKRIIALYGHGKAVLPQSHAPMQNDGDLSRVPLFENKAFEPAVANAGTLAESSELDGIEQTFKSVFKDVRKGALNAAYALYFDTSDATRKRVRDLFEIARDDDSREVAALAIEYADKITKIENQILPENNVGANQRHSDRRADESPQETSAIQRNSSEFSTGGRRTVSGSGLTAIIIGLGVAFLAFHQTNYTGKETRSPSHGSAFSETPAVPLKPISPYSETPAAQEKPNYDQVAVADDVPKPKVSSAWLGVQIQNVDDKNAEGPGSRDAKGALVAKVLPEGPAALSELKARDIIQQVNGKPVSNAHELAMTIAALPPGSYAHLHILRNGKARDVTVKLGEFSNNDKLSGDENESSKELEDLSLTLVPAPDFPGSKSKEGVAISNVDPNSKAADQGLKRGDVILEVNGKPVSTPDDFADTIKLAREKGRKNVLLQIRSRDQQRFLVLPIE